MQEEVMPITDDEKDESEDDQEEGESEDDGNIYILKLNQFN